MLVREVSERPICELSMVDLSDLLRVQGCTLERWGFSLAFLAMAFCWSFGDC